jgi:hypothetical protein
MTHSRAVVPRRRTYLHTALVVHRAVNSVGLETGPHHNKPLSTAAPHLRYRCGQYRGSSGS